MNVNGFSVEVPTSAYFQRLVSCREACPVQCGRLRARDCRRSLRGRLHHRPHTESIRFGVRPRRVCNAPCEVRCWRGAIDTAVAIRALKRLVTERFGVESGHFDIAHVYAERAAAASGKRIAVVGAGLAGLACAHDLALLGFRVAVFEAQQVAGGMLVLGVPAYRLPCEIVQAEIDAILSLGAELRLGQRLGRDFSLADLRAKRLRKASVGASSCIPAGGRRDVSSALKWQRLDPVRPKPPLYMPAWSGKIGPGELDDLVAFLRSLFPKEEKREF